MSRVVTGYIENLHMDNFYASNGVSFGTVFDGF
jgi:hypothetical protein